MCEHFSVSFTSWLNSAYHYIIRIVIYLGLCKRYFRIDQHLGRHFVCLHHGAGLSSSSPNCSQTISPFCNSMISSNHKLNRVGILVNFRIPISLILFYSRIYFVYANIIYRWVVRWCTLIYIIKQKKSIRLTVTLFTNQDSESCNSQWRKTIWSYKIRQVYIQVFKSYLYLLTLIFKPTKNINFS